MADMEKRSRKYADIAAITNRRLCSGDFLLKLEELCRCGIGRIILREKDMSEREYEKLAKQVLAIGREYDVMIILHTFIGAAQNLGHRRIHLTMEDFRKHAGKLKDFETVGVSTHSVEEAVEAERLGADYITASHIYETECKRGLEPRGMAYLKAVLENVRLPVYALGGIHPDNMHEPLDAGAAMVCMMSELMREAPADFCRHL